MRRASLTALIVFLPISGLLWLGAPWSTSRAGFELTGKTLFEEARARFSDLTALPMSLAESTAWLQSEEAAKVVLGNLAPRHVAALTETGERWSVKLRERMRALTCYEQMEAWRLGDKTICSWLGKRSRSKAHIDQLEIIGERLLIRGSGDGQQINIAFRAADHDIATTIVDAFGDALLERHSAARQDLRRRVVEEIETEFVELTRRKATLEAPLTVRRSATDDRKEDPAFALLAKFTDALKRAREELPANDRQRLSRELEGIDAVARNQLLSQTTDRMPVSTIMERAGADSSAVATSSLMLLSHPDWSKPPVIRISETITDSFSVSDIAAIAFVLSLMIGIASSLLWPSLNRRFERQHSFYASPYANPHWPNMRILKETDLDKAT